MAVECIFVCLSSCALEPHGESVGGKSDVGAGLSLWCQCCDFVTVRGGFLHLTEALSFRRDPDLISSTVCAIIATLKSGEKCNVEPELISKGMDVILLSFAAAAAWTSSPARQCLLCRLWESAFSLDQKMWTDLNSALSCITSFPPLYVDL